MTNQIRLVGLDLDNTALNSQKRISPRVRSAIQNAIAAGITVLPATGRIHAGITPEFLGIPGVRYALSSNGAVLHDGDDIIYTAYIPVPDVLDMLAFLDDFDVLTSVYVDGGAYNRPVDYDAEYGDVIAAPLLDYIKATRQPVPDLAAFVRENNRPVEKLNLIFSDMAERERTRQALAARGGFALTTSLPFNLELNAAGVNKGSALLELARRLGIPREGVMAMGDSDNDLEMLRAAGHGVAMGDALPEVKAQADEVTATADEDGVALVLERVMAEQAPKGDTP